MTFSGPFHAETDEWIPGKAGFRYVTDSSAHFNDRDFCIFGRRISVKSLLISLVMCGITCTVPPPKSPLRSFCKTDQ